jgi:hypothetical protein
VIPATGYLAAETWSEPDIELPATLVHLDPAALRHTADRLRAVARAIGAACAVGDPCVGQLTRGWSAVAPRVGVTRLLSTARRIASVLANQAAAMDATCVVMERAMVDAEQDILLARTQLRAGRVRTGGGWGFLIGGEAAMHAMHVASILNELQRSLDARVAAVDAALHSLQNMLTIDPTAGADALRAGPQALLPPDPVLNPAHRTDVVNRSRLAADLHSVDPARMKFAMSIVQSLRQAGDRAGTAQLVVYDPTAFSGQGRAAISLGDLTTARNVAVLVPGIGNSPSAMSGGIQLAGDLRVEAMRQSADDRTAVVAWYGYDIPMSWSNDPGSRPGTDILDTVAAGSAANARAGAPILAADLTAIKAMSQTSVRTTLLGFSMGSTTVSEAAQYDLPVDSMVLMGSPGAGWDTVAATGYRNVHPEDVYTLSYDQDPVTLPVTDKLASRFTGRANPYGSDPASNSFGGNHIDAKTNVPLVTGTGLTPSLLRILGDPAHHSMQNYMQGAALAAEASIVVGRKRAVPTKNGR